jgi:hypothetical protein
VDAFLLNQIMGVIYHANTRNSFRVLDSTLEVRYKAGAAQNFMEEHGYYPERSTNDYRVNEVREAKEAEEFDADYEASELQLQEEMKQQEDAEKAATSSMEVEQTDEFDDMPALMSEASTPDDSPVLSGPPHPVVDPPEVETAVANTDSIQPPAGQPETPPPPSTDTTTDEVDSTAPMQTDQETAIESGTTE